MVQVDVRCWCAWLRRCDVVTMEIEHVNVDALFELEAQGIEVEPKASTIAVIQVRPPALRHPAGKL